MKTFIVEVPDEEYEFIKEFFERMKLDVRELFDSQEEAAADTHGNQNEKIEDGR